MKTCRTCSAELTPDNTRVYNGRLLTQCRECENANSRTRAKNDDRVHTALRLPEDLLKRLREAAEERDLSMNFLVVKAVEEFLENLIPAEELRLTRWGK